jgi:hypothetical protein
VTTRAQASHPGVPPRLAEPTRLPEPDRVDHPRRHDVAALEHDAASMQGVGAGRGQVAAVFATAVEVGLELVDAWVREIECRANEPVGEDQVVAIARDRGGRGGTPSGAARRDTPRRSPLLQRPCP